MTHRNDAVKGRETGKAVEERRARTWQRQRRLLKTVSPRCPSYAAHAPPRSPLLCCTSVPRAVHKFNLFFLLRVECLLTHVNPFPNRTEYSQTQTNNKGTIGL